MILPRNHLARLSGNRKYTTKQMNKIGVVVMDGLLKFTKIIALLIPTILSGVILYIIITRFNQGGTDVELLEAKLNVGLSIIGIAISVWIGLNIYNVVEKKEVEKVSELYRSLEIKTKEHDRVNDYLQAVNNWHDTFLILLQEITISPIKETGNTNNIIKNTEILINEFMKLKEFNSKLVNRNAIPYHKQYNILLQSLDISTSYKSNKITKEKGLKFVEMVLNAILQTISEDEKELTEQNYGGAFEGISDFFEFAYGGKEDMIINLESRLHKLNWINNKISRSMDELKEISDKIIPQK